MSDSNFGRAAAHIYLDGAVLDEVLLRRRVPSSLIPTIVLPNAPPQSTLRAQVAFDAPPRFDGLLTRYRRLGTVHERRHRLARRTSCRGWVRPRSPRSAERRATEFIRTCGRATVRRSTCRSSRPPHERRGPSWNDAFVDPRHRGFAVSSARDADALLDHCGERYTCADISSMGPRPIERRTNESRAVWKSTSASGAPDNSSLSHFSAMTRPRWPRRAMRNRHRHAIEQATTR